MTTLKTIRHSTLLLLASATAVAQTPPENVRNFVSCPIVRDTNTVPCWLSEYDGELYYLGIQTDISASFHPPYLGHKVVVEGRVSDQPRICGGIVLDPVHLSVVPELDKNCDTILPAEDRYQIDFSPRPPGPSGGRLAFAGAPRSGPASAAPTEGPREFTLDYSFDGKVEGRNGGQLARVVRYAQSINASRIIVVGYSSDALMSDGTVLKEKSGMAQARAEEAAKLLQQGGLAGLDFDVSWQNAPAPDGLNDWEARRTEVTVLP